AVLLGEGEETGVYDLILIIVVEAVVPREPSECGVGACCFLNRGELNTRSCKYCFRVNGIEGYVNELGTFVTAGYKCKPKHKCQNQSNDSFHLVFPFFN